jgi:hypothetical protein
MEEVAEALEGMLGTEVKLDSDRSHSPEQEVRIFLRNWERHSPS